MRELLDLTHGFPERVLAAGDVLVAEGDSADHLYVLVEGELLLRRGDDDLLGLDRPGTCVGEKAVLLGRAHQSTILATVPTRVRVVEDAAGQIRERPEILLAVATLLAGRLDLVESFLADLQHQYREHDGGLGMIGEVLGALARHHAPTDLRPGSDRDPDPLY